MRTQTTSQQDRNTTTSSREAAGNQPRAARPPSKKTAPMAEVRAESPKSEKVPTREQQPRQAAKPGRRPVRFALRSPNAQNVAVAGSFNGWQPSNRLTQRDGQWMCEIELEPGT